MIVIINGERWRPTSPPKSWKALCADPYCLTCRQTLTVFSWRQLVFALPKSLLKAPHEREKLVIASRENEPVAIGCCCGRRPLLSNCEKVDAL
jgi:hypothetical protein